jgi:lipoyl(octanoyl) transferase
MRLRRRGRVFPVAHPPKKTTHPTQAPVAPPRDFDTFAVLAPVYRSPGTVVAAASSEAEWRWLGRVPFAETAALQERVRHDVLAGRAAETLLLCEHDPVITLGRSARAEHVLASGADLARRGVALHAASRGGGVTYHGPGQLVGYPVLHLRGGLVSHLEAMARGLASLLRSFGIAATWRRDAPGLWTDRGKGNPLAKICAFGVHVRHRVTIHGFALNVTTALDAFDLIVPCGLRDVAVTSMAELAGDAPAVAALAPRAAEALADAFGVSFIERAQCEP